MANFLQIDASNIEDHARLTVADEVYFLFEYTSRKRYDFSATNQLISNLKKKPSLAGSPQYRYKRNAVRECAQHLAGAINPLWLNGATLVPVPPSKALDHPDYDDRMTQTCRAIPAQFTLDVRELVVQSASTRAAHECGEDERPTVEELLAIYQINETLTNPVPQRIAIMDDVLTAGTHYRAMHHLLTGRFPGVPIVGMFIARRVFPPDNPFAALDIEI